MVDLGLFLLLGLTLSLDNLRVALAMAAAGASARLALRLSVAFAVFEGLMPLIGLLVGSALAGSVAPWAEALGAATLAATGGYIVVAALREEPSPLPERSWVLIGVPVSLSFDNLAAGFGLGLLGLPAVGAALGLGVISGTVCFIGFRAGHWVNRLLPDRAQVLAGVALLALAGISMVGG